MNDLAAAGVDLGAVNAAELAKVVRARADLPRPVWTEAVSRSADADFAAERYLAQVAVSGADELEPVIAGVLAANPGEVEQYRGGKEGLIGFFVGQVMKETQGKANPKVVNELLREKLKA
jgi:aspartyl-tRNA(Asn)/glutamyl-tRNA(Gln) amidotransferase subunit B